MDSAKCCGALQRPTFSSFFAINIINSGTLNRLRTSKIIRKKNEEKEADQEVESWCLYAII